MSSLAPLKSQGRTLMARFATNGSPCGNMAARSVSSWRGNRISNQIQATMFSPSISLNPSLPANAATTTISSYQQTTTRQAWTKAKKKRRVRHNRRTAWEAKGKPLPRPSYYTPIESNKVVNAVDREEQRKEISEHDAKVSKEFQEKLSAAKSKVFLRHGMSKPTGSYTGGGLVMSDRVRKLFDLQNGSQYEVVQAQKQQGMEMFQMRPGDTGSTAVQVVALTTRIQQLQTHMHQHHKDKHSKRGMDALYVRRRKLLDYLEREDFESYRKVVKTLGLTR